MIDLTDYNKAEVLAALYNASRPLGLVRLRAAPDLMSKEAAELLLEKQTYFNYVQDRAMKIDLSGEELDPRLYDWNNGQGAAERALGDIE